MLSQDINEFRDYWNPVFPNDYAFHLDWADLGVPVVRANVSDRDTLCRVGIQNLFHEVFQVDWKWWWYRVITSQNLLIQFVGIWILEGKVSTCHSVENDAAGPDIRSEAVVLLAGNHLRGSIARTATSCLKESIICVGIWKAEIDDLDVLAFVEQKIFRFQISMADATAMNVLHTADHLLKELASFGFL